jgi:hypothetical protein
MLTRIGAGPGYYTTKAPLASCGPTPCHSEPSVPYREKEKCVEQTTTPKQHEHPEHFPHPSETKRQTMLTVDFSISS